MHDDKNLKEYRSSIRVAMGDDFMRTAVDQFAVAYREARAHWNAALSGALASAIGFYRPAAVVFDGNIPYVGLMAALSYSPEAARIWIRRGLWGANRDADALERSNFFDLVIEPNEVVPAMDDGPTSDWRMKSLCVPPIRVLDPEEMLDREEACAELGLRPGDVNVLVAP